MIDNGILYFISQLEEDPVLRLVLPNHLRGEVLLQYHDNKGHMALDKTFDAIKQKYYLTNL